MDWSVWNKLLATGKAHDQVFTDEAMKQLREQLVGKGVYSDYTGPRQIVMTSDEPGLYEGRSVIQIGHIKAVYGDRMTIDVADEILIESGEEVIAKIDMLVAGRQSGDGAIIVEGIREVLGVTLVKVPGVESGEELEEEVSCQWKQD